MSTFKKILIANRGEIALRIVRTAKEMGIGTAAVYSEADRCSLHVRRADEAYPIGESQAAESYLNIDKLIRVARDANADAIHPGYGFLSENHDFARRCEEAGIVFIGPTSETIRLMGDKIAARKALDKTDAPRIPGTQTAAKSADELAKAAKKIGYPVMIKAVGGGGGRGIRIAREEKALRTGFRLAASEAQSAFGNAQVYLEKFLQNVRHIEVQILADEHGNVIHLNERECSIQRRRQKLIEETPCQFISEALRQGVCRAAVTIATAIGYRGAGTVEFVVDAEENFYFLEMNTRLQVEHPISEVTLGIDLVRQQIQIAQGRKLAIEQHQTRPRGAAMEVRVCAEDPQAGFAPSIGRIKNLALPGGQYVRVDSGLFEGCEVSLYYDPLIAKLVVWGHNRTEVVERMKRALDEFSIGGIRTTIPLLRSLLEREDFVAGRFDTQYLERLLAGGEASSAGSSARKRKRIAVLAATVRQHERAGKRVAPATRSDGSGPTESPWQITGRRRAMGRGER